MAISNINAKSVNRITEMCVCLILRVNIHCMVACLFKAVSLRGYICIKILL